MLDPQNRAYPPDRATQRDTFIVVAALFLCFWAVNLPIQPQRHYYSLLSHSLVAQLVGIQLHNLRFAMDSNCNQLDTSSLPQNNLLAGNMYQYSIRQLLSIRDSYNSAENDYLNPMVMKNIRHLGINKIRATRRGCRGGKQKHKARNTAVHQAGVCQNNLIKINPIPDHCKPVTNFLLLNCRSVCNKALIISEYILDNSLDVALLTETWLQDGDSPVIDELTPIGYSYLGTCREHKRGRWNWGCVQVIIEHKALYPSSLI